MPIQKEKTLELEFTSSEPLPDKVKNPQKTQRASEQDTVNSGKSNPNLPKESGKPAPEISTKKNFLQKIFNKPAPQSPQPQKQEAKPIPPQPPQPQQQQPKPPSPRQSPYTPPSPPKPQPKTISDNKPFLPVFKPKASQNSEDKQILSSSDTQQNPAPVSSPPKGMLIMGLLCKICKDEYSLLGNPEVQIVLMRSKFSLLFKKMVV